MNRLSHRCLAVPILVLLAAGGMSAPQHVEPLDRPNVVMILVDDLGYGDLSSYGARDLRTPNLDKLVEQGMRFDSFYANCPVCSPTRAALLTGRYPDLVGVPGVIRTYPEDNWGHLSSEAVLLPQVLGAAGYHTALVGKWHLGLEPPNTPHSRGFAFVHGFLGDMMDDYYDHRRHGQNYMRRDEKVIDPAGHATDLFTAWARDYLQSRVGREQPFFLYLAYNAPHTPIQPPEAWLRKVQERDPTMSETRARLVALIEHLDHGIGEVLSTLRETGLSRNTLILFTSDNGGQLNVGANCGPLRGGKQDLYEGGVRVPMCAVWPGKIKPGARSPVVAATFDLFPTICDAAGVRVPELVDGSSLLPILLGREAAFADRDLIWMRREGGARYQGQDYYALRRGPWKLMHNEPFEPYQLFHLERDPSEQQDVSSQHPTVFKELATALRHHLQRSGAVPWQGPRLP